MGFTGRGIAMHGVAKIALFGPLLSQKSASSQHLYQQFNDSMSPPDQKKRLRAQTYVTFVTLQCRTTLQVKCSAAQGHTHHPFKRSNTSERAALYESVSHKIKTQPSTIRSVIKNLSKSASSAFHLGAAVLLVLLQLDGPFIGNAEASVGIGTEGRVYGWGRAYWLGVNETDTLVKQKVPTLIHNPASPDADWTQNFTSLSGKNSVCGVTNTGAGYCLGGPTATAVPGNHTWKMIAAGFSHKCGVTTAGVAYCWGTNTDGQLGNGTTTDSTNPVAVSGWIDL